MAAWTGIVGNGYTPEAFDAYCRTLRWAAWKPGFVVLHNTGAPSLAQRPLGFTRQHMAGFEAFYRDTRGWSAGPHLFVDDRLIWVFTPLTRPGVHSPSWNRVALGCEMLGDYDRESFTEGRGGQVRANAVAALATLAAVAGIEPGGMRLHREDPLTTHACPGRAVEKAAMVRSVRDLVAARHAAVAARPVGA
ncbi:N-acetylmuramoyl-L-alanine amidase [Roseomonas sp. NAR14]|uniref:N-acetylmuramoyl-L-alanine amidase n=1 Tax=Roseomonas acroporae TaxID=2937791 RepID=A0A9X1Y6T9_9PROT|nr:N-acetylmuramoyl-L-alanine amidase [Roseomonas acroporae]MCK8784210.1 N-acetylmuramoyl-L-alanine amidase [Roseomonas acroporae]